MVFCPLPICQSLYVNWKKYALIRVKCVVTRLTMFKKSPNIHPHMYEFCSPNNKNHFHQTGKLTFQRYYYNDASYERRTRVCSKVERSIVKVVRSFESF